MIVNVAPDVLRLIELVSEKHPEGGHAMGDLTARVKGVSAILSDHENLMADSELMGQVWAFVEKNNDPAIQKLREQLLFNSSCNIETLTLSEKGLEELGNDLWGMIEKHGVKKLVIQLEGKQIEYGARVLKQFMKMDEKPPVEDLTDFYTLQFEDGPVQETKAHLLLCGEHIQTLLGQEMKEAQTHLIDFTESILTPDVFNDILQEVKTGERDMEDKDYKIVCDHLLYSGWTGIPEGAIGPEQWKSVGFEVKEVPPLPDDIDEILKSDCPYFKGEKVHETHKLILIPGGLSINKQGSLMRHLRKGDVETVFNFIWYSITEEMMEEEVTKPYWALVTTDVIPDSRCESFLALKWLLKEGYEVPSVLDAIVLFTMDKECSKGKKGYLLPKIPYTLTLCKEQIGRWDLVVGASWLSGLDVDFCDIFNTLPWVRSLRKDLPCVGVLALRKFC